MRQKKKAEELVVAQRQLAFPDGQKDAEFNVFCRNAYRWIQDNLDVSFNYELDLEYCPFEHYWQVTVTAKHPYIPHNDAPYVELRRYLRLPPQSPVTHMLDAANIIINDLVNDQKIISKAYLAEAVAPDDKARCAAKIARGRIEACEK